MTFIKATLKHKAHCIADSMIQAYMVLVNKKHMDEHVSASQILNPKTLRFCSLDILASKYRAG